MRRIAVGSILILGFLAGGTSAAFAGETTGNGKPVPRNGTPASECHYSGQDIPDATEGNPPSRDDDNAQGVQNYGHLVKQGLKPYIPSPGEACRGNLSR